MSIWSSVGKEDVMAADLHAETTHMYTGVGRTDVNVDVATATPWNDRIRLALFDDTGRVDLCMVLDVSAAELLRQHLDEALAVVRKAYPAAVISDGRTDQAPLMQPSVSQGSPHVQL